MENIFSVGKREYRLQSLKNKTFYEALVQGKFQKPTSMNYWGKKCKVTSTELETLYVKRVTIETVSKIVEFNYKLLHNLIVTNRYLNKFKKDVSPLCKICSEEETVEHMLFTCKIVTDIWAIFEKCFGCKLNWKLIMFGYPYGTNYTDFIERNVNCVMYAMYKYKIRCKMKDENFNCNYMKRCIIFEMKCLMQVKSVSQNNMNSKITDLIDLLQKSLE